MDGMSGVENSNVFHAIYAVHFLEHFSGEVLFLSFWEKKSEYWLH
jgi:hypothetical protein